MSQNQKRKKKIGEVELEDREETAGSSMKQRKLENVNNDKKVVGDLDKSSSSGSKSSSLSNRSHKDKLVLDSLNEKGDLLN